MRLPIPEEIGKPITTKIILDSLPNKTQSVQSIALSKSLSEYAKNEVFLGKVSWNPICTPLPQSLTRHLQPAQDTLHSDRLAV